ncbi:universal stress protein [Nakamurella multipartita]|uniref:UspA domain protein n=1 Tax=Nakamurella multipartita (strain ATCC 700099 / DSM 44233 / CIP 104796 / JCM 9543 / NBRC 105858 / Y-104) TaxID=479431 RepID=C8XH13_NAKMY|nr:universal stress protein [Nakamurella multipartita]ACV80244.1 UspA domain protein [Nakamurella multipartita DSM 44233]
MKDYRTIIVGTDGSALAEPTVGRAAWLAKHDDADLVIVCAYAQLSRRTEAKNVATLGGDSRTGQVLGREAASVALAEAMRVATAERATVAAALLIDGDPSTALVVTAEDRSADLIVLGALHDRSLADRVLGWTATEVTKRARCDVLIVRPEYDQGDLAVPEDAPAE